MNSSRRISVWANSPSRSMLLLCFSTGYCSLYVSSTVGVALSNAFVQVMVSPFFFPVVAESFNFVSVTFPMKMSRTDIVIQASVIFGAVTIFGILSWYFTPEHKWLRREKVVQALAGANIHDE